MAQYAKYLKLTLKDETVCPFCEEGCDTQRLDSGSYSEKWHCFACDNDYVVSYKDEEHDKVESVMTSDKVELTDDVEVVGKDTALQSRIQLAINRVINDGENGYIEETLSWAADVLGIKKSHKLRLDNDITKLRKDLGNMIMYCNESYKDDFVISVLTDCLYEVNSVTEK